jgi:hypothetical protein
MTLTRDVCVYPRAFVYPALLLTPSDTDSCALLKLPTFKIIVCKPSPRPFPQLRSHLAYQ